VSFEKAKKLRHAILHAPLDVKPKKRQTKSERAGRLGEKEL
jgi:hypothetical protein